MMRDQTLDRCVGLECKDCPLQGTITPIKPHDPGNLWNGILVVGEAPGTNETRQGRPFVGEAGILQQKVWRKELNMNVEHCHISNVLLCQPPKNRNPRVSEIKACVPSLIVLIEELQPKLIVAVGNFALKALTGKTGITKHSGTLMKTAPSPGIEMVEGYQVLPTIHPAAVLKTPRVLAEYQLGVRNIGRFLQGTLVQPNVNKNYKVSTDCSEIIRILSSLPDVISVDVETTGLLPHDVRTQIKTIGIGYGKGNVLVFDLRYWTATELTAIVSALREPLESRRVTKILHNCKFDMNFLSLKLGIDIKPPIFDTKVAQYLCNETIPNDLKSMAWMHTTMGGYEDKYPPVETLEGNDLYQYQAEDADATFQSYEALGPLLVTENVDRVFRDLLMPAQFPLAEMEKRGIKIDMKAFSHMESVIEVVFKDIITEMNKHQAIQIFEKVNKEKFNPASTTHLREVVFNILQMSVIKTTPTGHPSVDAEVMSELAGKDPLIDLVVEHKEVQKIKSTYVEGMKDKIINGRIHTRYLTAATRSGRTASSNPNLQNLPIPKEGSVMERHGLNVRNVFIPDDGCVFFEPDYNQHELRLMCIVSQDKAMKYIFDNGLDIHEETAKEVFRTQVVSRDQRREAKVVNFGILYGMGASKLAHQLGVSKPEAQEYIRRTFNKYWGVQKWQHSTEQFMRRNGYVETITGRRRRFPTVDGILTADDIRQGLNTPIQGPASDILLYSIIAIHKMFRYYKMRSYICAQVHDSLLINVHKGEEQQVKDLCTSIMLKPPLQQDLIISLAVDWKEGPSWGGLKDV